MSRFLGIAIFLTVALGLTLHAGMELPWFLGWVGDLPGDVIIHKGDMSVYAPLTSSILISALVSFFLSLFAPKRN